VAAGTLARVQSVSQAGVPSRWCFACEWLPSEGIPAPRTTGSLNLFEGDLEDFEAFTGPLPSSPCSQKPRRAKDRMAHTPSPQLTLPYADNEFISNRLDREEFPLSTDALWDFDLKAGKQIP
jgi:hypothetical protein